MPQKVRNMGVSLFQWLVNSSSSWKWNKMPCQNWLLYIIHLKTKKQHFYKSIFCFSTRIKPLFSLQLPSPRIIKCHMPVSMLPPELFTTKGCKVVYVCRNPKDTCVSYFHHCKLLFPHFNQTFEEFERVFMKGTVEYGSYWYHLKVRFSIRFLVRFIS